jgi:four helix bundle protein
MAGYRDLVFYQKGQDVVKGVNKLVKPWPKTMQAQEISGQLFRAATSLGANIAEGHGRHQGREYIHYLIVAQGSANEVDHWLHTALDCGLGLEAEVQQLIGLNNEVRKMLNATISTLKARQSNSTHETSSPYTLSPYPIEEI